MKRPLLFLLLSLAASASFGYVDRCPTLPQVVLDARHIVVLEVEKVSRDKGVVIYKKVADVKGQDPQASARHEIARGSHPREPRLILDWAEPGKRALSFHDGKIALVCLGRYWYECAAGNTAPWWHLVRGRSEMPRTYFGSVEKLRARVTALLAGQPTAVTVAGRSYEMAAFQSRVWMKHQVVGRVVVTLKAPAEQNPAEFGAAEIQAMADALRHSDRNVRIDAADELGLIGAAAKAAIPPLDQATSHEDPLTRVHAALALALVSGDRAAARPALGAALRHKDPAVRAAAAEALGEVGDAKAVAPALEDADLRVRWQAADALGSMGRRAESAVPALVEALNDAAMRGIAAHALGDIGAKAAPAAPALLKAFEKAEGAERYTILVALARIGGVGARAAAPHVLKIYQATEEDTRAKWDALVVLGRIGPEAKNLLAPATRNDKYWGGPAGWPSSWGGWLTWYAAPGNAVDFLLQEFWRGSSCAAIFLGITAGDAVLPHLSEAAKSGDAVAAWAAELIQEKRRGDVPFLVQSLKDKNEFIRWGAASALLRLGPKAKGAAAALGEALKDENVFVRREAVETLGLLGPESAPALQKALKDADEEVRQVAAAALKKAGR